MDLKTITRTTGTLVFRALGALSMLLLSLIVTRITNANEAGKFFYCITLIVTISTITRYGTDYSVVKMVSRREGGFINKPFLTASLRITFLFSLVFSIILALASGFVADNLLRDNSYSLLLKYVASAIPVTSLINVYASYYQSVSRPYMAVFLRNIVQYLLFSILVGGFSYFMHFNAIGMMKSFSLLSLVIFAVIFYFDKHNLYLLLKADWLKKRAFVFDKFVIKNSWKYFLISVYTIIIPWSILIISGVFLKNSDIAILSVSFRVANVLALILIAVQTVVAPVFSKLYYEKKFAELNKFYINTVKILTVVTTPIVLFFFLFSHLILSIFGGAYNKADFILKVMLVGQYINVITGPVAHLYMMAGRERFYELTQMWICIFSVILPFIMFYFDGLEGGAFAYSAILIIQNLFLFSNFFTANGNIK